jgi:phosphate transport system protein
MSMSMVQLRQEYSDRLAQIEQQALDGLDLVVEALDAVLAALLARDVQLAGAVVAGDDRIDERYLETHQAILSLLALQAPVAGDLRVIAALLHVIRHVERMGDQCVTIAKLIPLDAPDAPVDEQLRDQIRRIGELVRAQTLHAKRAFIQRDESLARGLERSDREINALNRAIFARAVEIGDEPGLREWGMHMTLVSRSLERIGDNAVDIGEQAAFVVTGRFREFSDASRARPKDL